MVKFKKGHKVYITDEEVLNDVFVAFLEDYRGKDSIVFSNEWVVVDIDEEYEIITCMTKSANGVFEIDVDFTEDEIELIEQTDELEFEVVDLQKADLTVDDFLDLVNLYDSLGDQESKQYYLDKLASI